MNYSENQTFYRTTLLGAFAAAMVIVGSGCSSLTYKKDPEKTATVKRVAIISIATVQPKTSGEKLLGALMGNNSHEMHAAVCESAVHLAPIAKVIEESMSKDAHLQVVPLTSVQENLTYMDINGRIKDVGVTMIMPGNSMCYHDDRAIDYYKWPRLQPEEIQKIKTALKVDAVMRVLVETQLNSTSTMGVAVGGAKTQVRLNVQMYNGIDKDPIWYDTNATGEEIAEGTTAVLGFSDRNVLNQKTVMGSQSAARQLMSRYQKGKI